MKRALLLIAVLALPAGSHAGGQRGPILLVTAETQNQLLAVDLASGRIVRRLNLPADPENVEAYAGQVAIVSARGGAVTLLQPRTLKVQKVIRGFGSPHIAAFAPDGEWLYVTDDARGELAVIRNRVVRKIFVGHGAHHMAFSPDQRRLWVALGESASSIAVVNTQNPARPKLIGHVDPHGAAHDLAFTPNGRYVWVTYSDRNYLRIFDARTGRRLWTVYAGTPPAHVRFDAADGLARYGRYAYVTSGNGAVLRVLGWRRRRLVRILRTSPGSYNLAVDHGLVATTSLTGGTLIAFRGVKRLLRERVAPAARDVAVLP